MTAFLTSVVVVRLMSKADYAALAYADNTYSYVTLFAGLGMWSAILKYCAGGDEERNRAYYRFAFKWGSLFQIALIAVVVLVFLVVPTPFGGIRELLLALAPYGFVYYWVNLFQSFLRTRFENRAFAASSLMQSVAALAFSVVLTPLIGAMGVATARAVAMPLSILAFWRIARDYFRGGDITELSRDEIRPFLALSLSMLVSNLFSMMMPMNEAFLVNNLVADEVTTANYRVANLIPSQLPFVTSIIVLYFFPSIAQMKPDMETWVRVRRIGVGTLLVVLAVCALGFILNPLIIRYVYGPAYEDATVMAAPLWFVYFANAGFRMLPMNALPALGYARFNAVAATVTGIVHFVLCYASFVFFGVYGSFFVRFLVNAVTGIIYWAYLRHMCLGDK